MGGSGAAVFWGDPPNDWANPALLARSRGIRYEWGRTKLLPALAGDIQLTSRAYKAGWAGAGVVLSGRPRKIGGVKLDYGTSEWVDAGGNVIGAFPSYETVDSWGFGVNAWELGANLLALADLEPLRLDRWADLSFGMNVKDLEISLAPAAL